MLQNRNIAFFIDLYNTELSAQHYDNIIEQLEQMGTIISGTIYGATERTHKEVLRQADECGYSIVRTPRRRGRKQFDTRILVDVVNKVNVSRAIDTVCIIAQPADMVYLYSFLRERGILVVSLPNCEEASMAFVAETVDSGKIETLKLPKAPTKRQIKVEKPVVEQVQEPVVEQPIESAPQPVVEEQPTSEPVTQVVEEQPAPQVEEQSQPDEEMARMDQLLKEIDRLREEVEQATQSQPTEQAHEQEPVEQPVEEHEVEQQPQAQPEQEPEVEPAPEEVAPEVVEQPVEQPTVPEVEQPTQQPSEQPEEQQQAPQESAEEQSKPRASVQPQDDSDLIRKIEEMRKTATDDEQLVEAIKKLLDDIE